MGKGLQSRAAAGAHWIWAQIARHRAKIPWAVAAALAAALWRPYADLLHDRIMRDPGLGVYIIAGLCLTAFVFWALIGTGGRKAVGWGTMLFWLTYCLIFWSADATDLLSRKRPQGFEAVAVPKTWSGLLPVRWGDWRYSVVGTPATSDFKRIIVVLRSDSANATRERLRYEDATLMLAASRGGASVIGVDASYADDKPEDESRVDSLFCDLVKEVKRPLVTAYEMRRESQLQEFVRSPSTDTQPQCLRSEDDQGQAMSLVDPDKRIRGIPLYWEYWSNGSRYPAFSLQVALKAGAKRPALADGFLRFLPPPVDVIDVRDSQADISAMGQHPDFFGGKILIIGSTSSSDRFYTPFDAFPGAEIHAFAVFDLLHGYYLRPCPAFLSAAIIFGSCFTILLLWWRQATARKMAVAAAVLSAVVFGISVVLTRYFLLWVNVIFAVSAIWLLLPILHLRSRWSSVRGSHP